MSELEIIFHWKLQIKAKISSIVYENISKESYIMELNEDFDKLELLERLIKNKQEIKLW